MLTNLRIRNLAVVEDAELVFDAGLNVLTGSTGAGKSLILSAVNLLLGDKASPDQIRSGEKSAEVEATFTLPAGLLVAGVVGPVVSMRRELRATGRSQAYIDGRPVTVRELHEFAVHLIEPHGQNEQYRLRDPESHVEYLDAFAGNESARARYTDALESYRSAGRELADFERRIRALREREELLQHRIAELERIAVVPGEKDDLERTLRVLENAERIAAALRLACDAIYDDDGSALSIVANVRRELGRVAGVDERIARFAREIETADIAMRETVDEIRAYLEGMEHDPDALLQKQERLDALIGLERRYGRSVDELAGELVAWRDELDGLAFEAERRAALEGAVRAAAEAVSVAASTLSDRRRKAAITLDRRMTAEMNELMMGGATFRTSITLSRDGNSGVEVDGMPVALYDHGVDDVRLYVRPNPGEAEGPVDRIASTGETSRIALALKQLTSAGAPGSVLIFDEIDAGVGADLGDVIADKLLELAKTFQIVCITHMPEIAARARTHLVVAKESAKGRTRVTVESVAGSSRTGEIARMLGGQSGSDHRLALADELLKRGQSRSRTASPARRRSRGA